LIATLGRAYNSAPAGHADFHNNIDLNHVDICARYCRRLERVLFNRIRRHALTFYFRMSNSSKPVPTFERHALMRKPMRRLLATLIFFLTAGCAQFFVTIEHYSAEFVENKEVSKYIESPRAEVVSASTRDGFILVRLMTAEDLLGVSQENSLIAAPRVRFCDQNDGDYRLNVPGINVNGKNLFERTFGPIEYESSNRQQTYDILLYINLRENFFEKDFDPSLSHRGHDLRRNPRDICISIRGGHVGARIYSNTIKIRKDSVIELLK